MVMALLIICSCQKDDSSNDNSPTNPTNGLTTAEFNPSINYGTMTDQDGNTYRTVTIGSQTWMAENLRTTKYNDGTDIFQALNDGDMGVTQGFDSPFAPDGGCTTYGYTTDLVDIATYGRLYDFYAVASGKLAPAGWRVATLQDYTTLVENLGSEILAPNKLKEEGFLHWPEPQNSQATNSSGFTALPAGYYHPSSSFTRKGTQTMFWTPIANQDNYYDRLILIHTAPYMEFQQDMSPNELCSVRLIKI